MLKFVSIRNFVIVDFLELHFTSGFTALTGETGAGKSILVDALSLAIGGRGDVDMVRDGCDRAEISVEFDTVGSSNLHCWLDDQELAGDVGICLLRRVVDANGRSRGFINGHSATLQQMRDAGKYLLDIYGQHEHQSLLTPDTQRNLLDGYANLTSEAEALTKLFSEWQALHRNCEKLENNNEALTNERNLLFFQKRELEALNFNLHAWVELQTSYARLAHAASLLEVVQFGVNVLNETDAACITQINALISRLRVGIEFDASLKDVLSILEGAKNDLQEVVYSLTRYTEKLDIDPQVLRDQEQQIAAVIELSRKHCIAPEKLPDVLRNIIVRLGDIGDASNLSEMRSNVIAARNLYNSAAARLSAARKVAADKFSREITILMQDMAMQGGNFVATLKPLAQGNAQGLEVLDFKVAINPGSPLRSLTKVASGGELSRIGLAIQVAASKVFTVPTLIFDEVDSGIGGRVAEIVGALLKRLGGRHQVMCVTHLPQVASMADVQYKVSKLSKDGATVSGMTILDEIERIEEIARMLGGVEITKTTRKHAAEMLKAK
jgi:DNA repair protein RecN (Recombination protein N)